MSPRRQVGMALEERRAFMQAANTVILSTIDGHGYPHAVAMWHEMDGDRVVMATFGKSQKAVNIRRNPKVAVLAESGETYDQLKGVLIRGRAAILSDAEACAAFLLRAHEKRAAAPLVPEAKERLRAQARKRVLIIVTPERVSSWDHTQLGGAY